MHSCIIYILTIKPNDLSRRATRHENYVSPSIYPGCHSDINQWAKLRLHLSAIILPQTNLRAKTAYPMEQSAITSWRQTNTGKRKRHWSLFLSHWNRSKESANIGWRDSSLTREKLATFDWRDAQPFPWCDEWEKTRDKQILDWNARAYCCWLHWSSEREIKLGKREMKTKFNHRYRKWKLHSYRFEPRARIAEPLLTQVRNHYSHVERYSITPRNKIIFDKWRFDQLYLNK